MLAHLAAVLGQDVTETDDVLVRRLPEHQGADGHQRVEPPTRLVDRLADVLRRVRPLEQLFRARRMRVSPLGERHRSGVEPRVDHLRHSAVRTADAVAGERDVVDVGAVRVEVGEIATGQLGQLLQGSDADQVVGILVVAPDGQRRAPVTVAGQTPVDVVVEPVAVAAPFDRLGIPVRIGVLGEQLVLDLGRADVPRRQAVVHQRRVAAPAVRIRVLVRDVPVEQTARLQVVDEYGVGLLEEHPADQVEVVLEAPAGVDRVDQLDAVAPHRLEVVGAVDGRLMHQPGAVVGRDVLLVDHEVAATGPVHDLERPLVGPADHLGAGERVDLRPAFAEDIGHQLLGDDQGLVAVGRGHVRHVCPRRDERVARQRPRRRGPDQECGLPGVRARGQR